MLPDELVRIDRESIVVGCSIAACPCSIKSSVLSRVTATSVDLEDCILINVTAGAIKAKRCLLYNVCDESKDGLRAIEGSVRADVFGLAPGHDAPSGGGGGDSASRSGHFVMRSNLGIDGKHSWSEVVEKNTKTFEEVYTLNMDADVLHAQALMAEAHSRVGKVALIRP